MKQVYCVNHINLFALHQMLNAEASFIGSYCIIKGKKLAGYGQLFSTTFFKLGIWFTPMMLNGM